ncbi:hypothetical protein EYZ11_001933 [Aspergillus tanneri]|uniref:RRM domain-containing protein n=1 Tax=Aspergillus tanneri TaxID=1220188 RepID=A0A4S3JU80_9EURO|nr:uncharacterized protein ATNIH1004_007489 [Aspergillus tanneri]KAA8646066.1 hypothetical protein ATNIH1004_007489 [Aspergillus tanneri]THC98581.1 hypothetical protein EYZ11_001933 [Aspergillus tanneri]
MLKPFQIRDLHRPPSPENTNEQLDLVHESSHTTSQDHRFSQRRRGIVSLSASQYNDIASNHPRARLTYVDDDDGELITVGSALELSQRLDEPAIVPTQLDEISVPEPIHVFDIRRSNSVVELWKTFEYNPDSQSVQRTTEDPSAARSANVETPHPGISERTGAAEDTSPAMREEVEPLLAAFEAEMVKILSAPDSLNENNSQQDNNAPSAEPQSRIADDRPRLLVENLINSMLSGSEVLGSRLRSTVPKIERQLQNAQQAIPDQFGSSMQVALTTLEVHARNLVNAINNASTTRGQTPGNIFQGGLPTAESTVEGLRNMASELGNMGHTLFEAFESELGCNAQRHKNSGPSASGPSATQTAEQEHPVDDVPVNDVFRRADTVQSSPPPATTLERNDTVSAEKAEMPQMRAESQDHSNTENVNQLGSHNNGPSVNLHQQPDASAPVSSSNQEGQVHPHESSHSSSRPYGSGAADYNSHFSIPRYPSHPPTVCSWFSQPDRQSVPPNFPGPFSHPRRPHGGWTNTTPYPVYERPPYTMARYNIVPPIPNERPNTSPADRSAETALFIGNLGFNVNDKMIRDVFAAKGFLVDVHLPLDSQTGNHAGFGYLHFPSIHAARAALDGLQGTLIDGHSINLEYSDNSPITTLSPSGRDGCSPSKSSGPQHSATEIGQASPQRQAPGNEQHLPANRGSWTRFSPPLLRPPITNGPDNPDLLNARYPSLVPGRASQPSGENNRPSESFPYLIRPAEAESRFPPVSQLDAHFLAEQRRETNSSNASSSRAAQNPGNNGVHGRTASPSIPGAFPEVPRSVYPVSGPPPEPHPQQSNSPSHTPGAFQGRRSRTVGSTNPPRRHSGLWNPGPSRTRGLDRARRRWSSERGSLQDNQPTANLPHPQRSQEPTTEREGSLAFDARQRTIDSCVSTLASLGYGSSEEGGLQRIAVYAAAADGRVSEAIEMIEEERKAYEQQGSW